MTYLEMREQRSKEFNDLPIFWAFGDDQFKKAMVERGLTTSKEDLDKVVQVMGGGLMLKKDLHLLKDFLRKPNPIIEAMKDFDFAVSAFYEEMTNHEYEINWQGDYDVCSCFGRCNYDDNNADYKTYLKEMGYGEDTIRAYATAKSKHYHDALERGWI